MTALFNAPLVKTWAFAAAALVMAALPARAEIEIQEVTTPGGISAWLVEEPSIPFVALELRFKGGGSLDAPDKRGATNLMVGLLEEGTGEMDARAFARELESLAASFDYDTFDDTISVSAKFLTDTTDAAMALLRGSLVAPAFNQVAIDRVKAQVLSGLASDLSDPDKIAGRTFDRLAFGDHPYATSLDGTRDSVMALSREDIVAAHAAAFARDRVYVSAVGDISAEELSALLDELLGDLPETGAPLPGTAPFLLEGGLTVEPFDTPQSVVLFGHRGLERDHPDFLAAYVINEVFGGSGLTSRLMSEVREKRGLTYGVYSYLVPKDHAALVMGSVASANNRVAETIAVIREEWAKLGQDGLTAEELAAAKTYLTGAYPLRFDGNGPIANILIGMQMDGLGPEYVTERNALVEALTLDEVNRVAAELYDPEALHFVVVGQPEGLETQ
ncbi:Peptidase M16 inactive domain protein [Marinovum algicola]|uniref:Zinc protease n=1 Tax=Marinovum algicola TaxID=42444 RepID=A0A975ZQG7_9RHOB|nr:pitrilysin family protein [Marinovum algicola]SEK05819.1 zinc protease [Marinovum algicola]SLN72431.1 Peptidase M16 inactive domain protein [Marinovum algicola]